MIEGVIASLGLANLLALGSVVLIGLPHGAFDGAIAGYLGYTARPQWLLRFLGLYLLFAAAVVMIWMYFPVAALIGFLVISMIHFGLGDASATKGWFRKVQAVSHGGIVVVAISQGHKQDVDRIFSYLVGGETHVVWTAIDVMSVVVAVALIVYAWQALWDGRWRAGFLEIVTLLSLFLLVPPLVGFAIYFCCVHSARHLLSIWRSINSEMPRKSIYFQAAFFHDKYVDGVGGLAGGFHWPWRADSAAYAACRRNVPASRGSTGTRMTRYEWRQKQCRP